MKKLFTISWVLVFAAVLITQGVFSQTPGSVTWTLFTDQTFTSVGNVTGGDQTGTSGFVVRSYTQAVTGGPAAQSQRWWLYDGANPVSWGLETGPVASRYIQFIAAPVPGNSFKIDSFTIYFAGGGTGDMKAFIEYATNSNFASPVKLPNTFITPANDTISGGNNVFTYVASPVGITLGSGQFIYIRIFPWSTGAASTSKYVCVQYAVVKGTTLGGSGVEQTGNAMPGKFELEQNYPNPFNPATQINYSIPKESYVSLKVYTLMGQEVATVVSRNQPAGSYSVPFDASRFSSGVYLYRLQAGLSAEVKRMMLVK
jgi:hypothetical protein